jgi:hypothetical protein
VDAQRTAWDRLKSEIEAGRVSRFQVQDSEDSFGATVKLSAKLDMRRVSPARPNHVLVRLPTGIFAADGPRAVQELLTFGKDAFERLDAAYGYAGVRVTARSTDAINHVVNQSANSVPVGDFFDYNIERSFDRHVKGAFWANFLGERHVEALGGPEAVAKHAPCEHIERLRGGGMLLVLSSSPLAEDQMREKVRYAQLSAFLRPITEWKTVPALPSLEKAGLSQRKNFNT